jgi:ketosteroid isomerase-like protein
MVPTVVAAAPDVGQVAEAERAFAALAEAKGISTAFKTYAADEGIMFVPDPRPAKAFFEKQGEAPGTLRWWPVYAGIAQSGDLGFSTGPYVSENDGRKGHGWFFTVWRRQADGSWRWLLDHGTPTAEASPLEADTPVAPLQAGVGGSSQSADELSGIEERLDRQLAEDAPAALSAALADDGRVMRVGPQPFIGRPTFSAALGQGPGRIEASRLGGEMSAARDLAYSYGKAAWSKDGNRVTGHYVRIWQHRAEGWRLIVDELVPSPPRAPAPTQGQSSSTNKNSASAGS